MSTMDILVILGVLCRRTACVARSALEGQVLHQAAGVQVTQQQVLGDVDQRSLPAQRLGLGRGVAHHVTRVMLIAAVIGRPAPGCAGRMAGRCQRSAAERRAGAAAPCARLRSSARRRGAWLVRRRHCAGAQQRRRSAHPTGPGAGRPARTSGAPRSPGADPQAGPAAVALCLGGKIGQPLERRVPRPQVLEAAAKSRTARDRLRLRKARAGAAHMGPVAYAVNSISHGTIGVNYTAPLPAGTNSTQASKAQPSKLRHSLATRACRCRARPAAVSRYEPAIACHGCPTAAGAYLVVGAGPRRRGRHMP